LAAASKPNLALSKTTGWVQRHGADGKEWGSEGV